MYPTRNALLSAYSLISLVSVSAAQFVTDHAGALNLTVVRSPADSNVTVSYRQPQGVCTTAFDSQRQYTGWVNVPGEFPTNLFFWFVEARQPTDLLTIWLNGGPGSSSLYGFFTGNGPCEVFETGFNEYKTAARDWGWDRVSNMLFIDQVSSFEKPSRGRLSKF
jgi:carboxypeptidase C (cathepsin A)